MDLFGVGGAQEYPSECRRPVGPGPSSGKLAENPGVERTLATVVFLLVMVMALIVYSVAGLRLWRWVKESGPQRLLSRIREAKKAQTHLEQQKEAQVRQAVAAFNVEFRRKTFFTAAVFCALWCNHFCWRNAEDLAASLKHDPYDRFVANMLYQGVVPVIAIHLVSVGLILSFPNLLKSNLFYVTYFVLMELRWHATLYYQRTQTVTYYSFRMIEMLYRVTTLHGVGARSLVIPINITLSMASLAIQLEVPALEECFNTAFSQEMFSVVLLSAINFLLTEFAESQARVTLEAQSSRTLEKAAETLMSGLCDAVVRISSDGEVLSPSSSLAALLLSTNREGLVGQNLSSLVTNEGDRERLLQVLSEGQEGKAGMLHVDLRDTWANPVPVQIFHARCVEPLSDVTFHIVGIRESGDGAQGGRVAPAESGDGAPVLSTDWLKPLAEVAEATGLAPARRRSPSVISRSISEDSQAQGPVPLIVHEDPRRVSVLVDVSQADFPILKASPEFVRQLGGAFLSRGDPLLTMISDAPALRQRVRSFAQALISEGETVSPTSLTIGFRPNFSNRHRVDAEVHVHLSVSMETPDQADLVELVCTKFRKRRGGRRHGPLAEVAALERSGRRRADPPDDATRAPGETIRPGEYEVREGDYQVRDMAARYLGGAGGGPHSELGPTTSL